MGGDITGWSARPIWPLRRTRPNYNRHCPLSNSILFEKLTKIRLNSNK